MAAMLSFGRRYSELMAVRTGKFGAEPGAGQSSSLSLLHRSK
jgi:hypothetical protein